MERNPKNINRKQKTLFSASQSYMYKSYQHRVFGHPLYLLVVDERVVGCSFSHKKHLQAMQAFFYEQPSPDLSYELLPRQFQLPLTNYLTGKSKVLDWPRDDLLLLRGSPFQRMVWKHIATISYGETCCYGDIARQMGGRKYARAVGGACNTNPLALLIPCHRAIARSGKLAGYRWGRTRKQAILAWEAARHEASGQPAEPSN